MQISPMRTDKTFPFAYHSMKERLPNFLNKLQARNNFTDLIQVQLDDLRQKMIGDAALPDVNYLAPDATIWIKDSEAYYGETWLNTEWFYSEMLFFREIINRVQYWQTGKDPYKAFKSEELYSDGLRLQLSKALEFDGSSEENLQAMLHFSLWGNRADLSLPTAMAHGQIVADDDLLIDDSELAVSTLLRGQNPVHVITDNFGTELAMDYALIYHLLKLDIPVHVHVKMNPTYVSDATAKDIHWMLQALPEISPKFLALTSKLESALDSGQLRVFPDFFWNSSRYYEQLPQYLHMAFSQACVIISKGDANYRRALYDTIWSADTTFSDVVHTIPAPILALRTLKSDPVVGLSIETVQGLDDADVNWRINGKRGIIQFAP